MIWVLDKETGEKIESVRDRDKGIELIAELTKQDRAEGITKKYDVIDGTDTSLI